MDKSYTYSIYGVTVSTPFPCPFPAAAAARGGPDVRIDEGPVPAALPPPAVVGDHWEAAPGQVLLNAGPHIGRFLASEGKRVTFERAPRVSDHTVAVQLLDEALAIILQQRGTVVFHGSAIVAPAGAILIAGNSGAGKSSLLTALLDRGCPMLCDDVAVTGGKGDGLVTIMPGTPHLCLAAEAASRLGRETGDLSQSPWRQWKSVVPTRMYMAKEAAPLRKCYLLRVHGDTALRLSPVHGRDRFTAIQQNLFGPLLPAQHRALFPRVCALARQTEVFMLYRPAGRWTVEELADILMKE